MFLEVSQLDVRYAGRAQAAVQGVTLSLQAGDIGVLIGPSGCGKTTLLRAVAGLEPVTGGEIRLTKSVVSSATLSLPPELRRIGMVFQDYALFPHLTVGRNVAFGIHQLPRAEQAARVAEVLRLVGLEGSEHRFPHELSGGQQQRARSSCCWTSLFPTWTWTCASAWRTRCAASSRRRVPRPCS